MKAPGLLLLALSALPLSAADFGLTIHQGAEISGSGTDSREAVLAPGLGPWFSDEKHESWGLYLSALINMKYEYSSLSGEGAWRPVPEPGRFSLALRPLPGLYLEAGRVRFRDPNGFIASGLFDGLSGSINIGNTRFSLAALYTGLLYRETAKVFMSPADSSWDHAVGDTVFSFAGRRVLASASWDLPSLFESPQGLTLNSLVQFDLNGAEEELHSQYLSLRFLVSPLPSLYAYTGFALGFAEYTGARTDSETSLMLSAGLDWSLPGALTDTLSFGLSWGSGGDGGLGAFHPVTTLSPSGVLSVGTAGLLALRGSYGVRARENLSLSLDCRYFFRENTGSFDTLALAEDPEKRALGGELCASLIWVPVSDISLSAGGGVFLPGLGNAVEQGAPPRWKATLTAALSL